MQVTIYHNAECGTSRNTLLAIRKAGHEPVIVEYMKTPLTRDQIVALIALAGLSARDAARRFEKLYREMELDRRDAGADELLDAMTANPSLLNRPFVTVVRDNGETATALCRPSERVTLLLQGVERGVSDYEHRRLKRVFAQGWTACERLSTGQRRVMEADGSAGLHPYKAEPERTRWNEGFDAARANRGRPMAKPKAFGRKGRGVTGRQKGQTSRDAPFSRDATASRHRRCHRPDRHALLHPSPRCPLRCTFW